MTVILKATPTSQAAADLSPHLRNLVLAHAKRTNLSLVSEETGVAYPRLRYWAMNTGVVPNDSDLAKLLAHYMPHYKVVPSMVVPVDKVA